MGGGSSNDSSPVLQVLRSKMRRENVLRALQYEMERKNETFSNSSFSFLVDSSSVRALGIRKWYLDFTSDMKVSLQNFHLMFAPGLGKLKRKFRNIQLWEFRIGNIRSENENGNKCSNRTFFFFVDSALEMKTEIFSSENENENISL
ncbi:hypothetical protein C1645_817760 [Glomus cerebriforme]|uniref:Uncharacterized protein n=1 Tax=Glomus cerebriforme TaxID=658196 RepID=A0A397T8N5_9GLOM|nr:hypothetical protein C1645_817760 [Glomus cerebriforme]